MPRRRNIYGGGAQTNANGLAFEQETSLDDALMDAGFTITENCQVFDGDILIGLSLTKHHIYRYFLELEGINYKEYNSKKWLPDDSFINFKTKTAYIIEKKFQNTAGSVDEKLPGCHFKKMEYEKLFHPLDFNVEYIYIFNDWFLQDVYRDVLEYIEYTNCEYVFNYLPLEMIGL